MRRFRQTIRLCRTALHVLVGSFAIRAAAAWDRLRGHPLHGGLARRVQARWCRKLCRILGMRVHVAGAALAEGPLLVVANHISWLDIPVIASHWGVGFLSKAEVRRWPLIGSAAAGLGTLFIRRGQRDAAADAAAAIRERLRAGYRVLIFPEGTTGDGGGLLPFRPRLYQAALDADAPVQILAISYHHPDGTPCREVPFVGDESLLVNFLRIAALPGLEARCGWALCSRADMPRAPSWRGAPVSRSAFCSVMRRRKRQRSAAPES